MFEYVLLNESFLTYKGNIFATGKVLRGKYGNTGWNSDFYKGLIVLILEEKIQIIPNILLSTLK